MLRSDRETIEVILMYDDSTCMFGDRTVVRGDPGVGMSVEYRVRKRVNTKGQRRGLDRRTSRKDSMKGIVKVHLSS